MHDQDKPPDGEIYVVGLGPGDPLQLPALNLSLMRHRPVYLRTGRHPVVPFLEREGLQLQPLDDFYERYASFDEVYREMASWLIGAACGSREPIVFAVPGHPLVGETVVRLLLAQAAARSVRVRLWSAPSFLDAVVSSLGLDPAQGLVVTESFQLLRRTGAGPDAYFTIPLQAGVLVAQVYNRALASEVKLTLMEQFPDDHPLTVIYSAGVRGQERQRRIPLYDLDRLDDLDHLTSVYVPAMRAQESGVRSQKSEGKDLKASREGMQAFHPASDIRPPTSESSRYPLDSLVTVMEKLLGPDGCPWDREQTHLSLRQYLIEESYEVIDAIDEGNMNKLCEELGDLLLQVVFHAALADIRGDFDINRVVAGIVAKLKRRHPHVFGAIQVDSAAQVVRNWEAIKRTEGTEAEISAEGKPRSLLAGAPRHLPSLQRAQKVQGKAALAGFDWPDADSASVKLAEEWQELQSAWSAGDEDAVRMELGDLLFAVVNVARLLKVDAEEALRAAVDKFMRRFQGIEARVIDRGLKMSELSLADLDAIWDEVKLQEATK
ncbi:MAG: nucleoside triphosphate pyrophosphohydrolase [Thermacetogeniaceae bacterium]|jgi:tetrapyrrole methylase family protein/MazG family protein